MAKPNERYMTKSPMATYVVAASMRSVFSYVAIVRASSNYAAMAMMKRVLADKLLARKITIDENQVVWEVEPADEITDCMPGIVAMLPRD